MRVDYSCYSFTIKEVILYLCQSLCLCAGINYFFYKSWWVFCFMIPVPVLWFTHKRRTLIKERQRQLNYQFRDALASLRIALQAGYSVENAVRICKEDLRKQYKKDDYIVVEFTYIESQLALSVSIEELFLDFGNRSKVEDISNFASIFTAAKRSGGDLNKIIQRTASVLGDKIEVKKEIEATIAGKKAEQTIMSVMPFAIILYMQISSPGFLQMLYGNLFGVITMTICLGIYFLAYWMGKRIVDIEV